MMSISFSKSAMGLSFAAGILLAQTQVDLKTQTKGGVDFQAAPYTKPLKAGGVLPATCAANELFFLTTAPAGSNIYACNTANVWSLEGGLVLLGGDVSGASTNSVVQRLQTRPLSSAAPLTGQALVWDGNSWSGQSISTLAGDVTGPTNGSTVQKLQNLPVSTNAPQTGQALIWNGTSWKGTTIPGAVGTVSVENSNAVVGTRGVENFIAGSGLVNVLTDTGTQINIQQNADTAILLTRANYQSGQTILCTSSGGSGTAYSCAMTPTLTSYQPGMVLQWKPDVMGTGGATTLQIDSLGAKPVKLADGVQNPQAGDIIGGQQYAIWFDGATFRLMAPPLPITGSAAARPGCNAGYRGRIWQIFSAAGIKDDVSVCAKDATDVYAWRVLY
jgi:hypothetical protein